MRANRMGFWTLTANEESLMQVPPIRYATPSDLHRGTTGALAQWLEQYVNALFPESGIESWYVPKRYPDMGS